MRQKLFITAFAGILGLALAIYLIVHAGFSEIFALLLVAGWGLLWLLPLHLLPLALDVLSWKWLLRGEVRARFWFLLWVALVREAVNGLLPVARVGGEFVGVRLLAQYGVPASVAGASVMVEVSLTLASQFIFTLLGVAVLFVVVGEHALLLEVLGTLLLTLPLMGAFLWLQIRGGFFTLLQKVTQKILAGYDILGMFGDSQQLDAEIFRIYSQGSALLVANAWQLAGFFAGTIEVWFTFWLLHHPLPFWAALLMESLGQALRSAAFVVPGGIGIQEGGFILFGSTIGVDADLALAFSLARRLREVFLGIPVLLSWGASEGHYMRRLWQHIPIRKEM